MHFAHLRFLMIGTVEKHIHCAKCNPLPYFVTSLILKSKMCFFTLIKEILLMGNEYTSLILSEKNQNYKQYDFKM